MRGPHREEGFPPYPGDGAPDGSELVLELPSDVQAIGSTVDFVMSHCASCHEHARRFRFNLRVGLTEALTNAMLYGNCRDPGKQVRIEVRIRERHVTARITDEGEGFDPGLVPDPTTRANRRRSCGRGLFLMRELMDEVIYNERGNSVTMVLRLDGEADGVRRAADLA